MTAYAWYEAIWDWPEMITALNELEIRLRREHRPVAADMLLRAYGAFRDELKLIGNQMSVIATEELRRTERHTRVRPDTLGGGGNRLEDSLEANPIPGAPPGSIGVANEDVLDQNVPWWITNEIGNSTNVGRVLFGFFYGADSASPPNAQERRVHPLFEPYYGGPPGGSGRIEHAIPARRFIAKSVPAIDSRWKREVQVAKDRFDTALTRVLATHH